MNLWIFCKKNPFPTESVSDKFFHFAKSFSMNGTGPVDFNRLPMLFGGIAHVGIKCIMGINKMHFLHVAITLLFGDDRRESDER